jgi:hypothetical protein
MKRKSLLANIQLRIRKEGWGQHTVETKKRE